MDDGIACAPAAPVRVSLANRGPASRLLPFAELQGVACLSVPVTAQRKQQDRRRLGLSAPSCTSGVLTLFSEQGTLGLFRLCQCDLFSNYLVSSPTTGLHAVAIIIIIAPQGRR